MFLAFYLRKFWIMLWLVASVTYTTCVSGKQRKVAEYYKKQERLLEGFNEMETMHETGFFPGGLTEVDFSIYHYDLLIICNVVK
jgi:hypothetical protein